MPGEPAHPGHLPKNGCQCFCGGAILLKGVDAPDVVEWAWIALNPAAQFISFDIAAVSTFFGRTSDGSDLSCSAMCAWQQSWQC
jgi:hypothetical protein